MPKMNFLKKFSRDNSGITGLETAIILIAFVVVAAVFAFTVMTTGLFSTEKAKTTAQAALTEASSSFIIKGAVTARANIGDGAMSSISFNIALASGADQQTMDPGELSFLWTDSNNSFATNGDVPSGTLLLTQDCTIAACTHVNPGPVPAGGGQIGLGVDIVEIVAGSTAGVLEAGDTAQVTLNVKTTDGGVAPDDWTAVTANSKVRIEMIAPKGGTLIIERTLPKVLTANMNLE